MGIGVDSITSTAAARFLFIAGLVLIAGGCVTKQEKVFTNAASPEEALERRVELARSYIGDGNWQDAKRNLKMAQEIDPHNPEVYEAFALVYQSTGEYELAEESFERAIRLKNPFSRARNNYAAFLYARGRYAEAEEQLQVVIKDTLYKSRPQAFINLGLCQVQLGKEEQAREAFRRALTMDRSNSLAMLELAHIEFNLGNFQAAETYLERYRVFRRQQSPRALWLGIRVAHALNDENAEASRVLALRNLYPQSAEYKAYQQAVQNGEL